jgi:hypothetical protein
MKIRGHPFVPLEVSLSRHQSPFRLFDQVLRQHRPRKEPDRTGITSFPICSSPRSPSSNGKGISRKREGNQPLIHALFALKTAQKSQTVR